jgi:FixJ family two-component response regulator
MNPTPVQTVFIVDDDADIRDALAMLMRAAGLQAETFASARDALQRLSRNATGCLVLDVRMPGMSGIELQAELHKRRIQLPIVFLTGHGDVPHAVKAMKAGACDFIQKPLDEHRLVMAVMNALKVSANQNTLPDKLQDKLSVNAEKMYLLTAREREVLELLLLGKLSREIAEALCISLKTVEFHRANIREKLGVANTHELFMLLVAK